MSTGHLNAMPRAGRDPRSAARTRRAQASRTWLAAREDDARYSDELQQARRVLRALARDDTPR